MGSPCLSSGSRLRSLDGKEVRASLGDHPPQSPARLTEMVHTSDPPVRYRWSTSLALKGRVVQAGATVRCLVETYSTPSAPSVANLG
jgi:hypothetical protein